MDSRYIGIEGTDTSRLRHEARQSVTGEWYVVTPEGGMAHHVGPDGCTTAARGLEEREARALARDLNREC
ncbi:hypothetical protein D7294_30300 [Streptomyces hoynatensis]|uniref:Uncharacterized protein n=1 Tax=Streptomyces hoynatensis TaxID=1141874 RepID=A0A3A9YKZ9_9ACTN|nr:hypothetical protein D7294_30300 [Streptomyces hoynatensis]